MKQKKNLKKIKRPNIPLRRKIAVIYSRFVISIKILLLFAVYLFFFTKYFAFIKHEIAQNIYEFTSDIGFKLENVLIEGQHNISSEDILSKLEADKGTPIFSIHLDEVKSNLEKNSWVKSVSIQRRMPDTIYIDIVERVPIAIWQINKKLFLIDDDGFKITSENIENFAHLPHVIGSDANIYATSLIKDLSEYPEFASKIISSVRYGERRWNLNLQQNITIKMPETGFKEALKYIIQLDKASKLFDKNYKVIDLRDKDKYYIEKF